jgi:hypothetical protein
MTPKKYDIVLFFMSITKYNNDTPITTKNKG